MPTPAVPLQFVEPKTGRLTIDGRAFCEFLVELLRGSPADRRITWGTGSPESVVTGSIGDLFVRTDGSAGAIVYTKNSGTASTTGWGALS